LAAARPGNSAITHAAPRRRFPLPSLALPGTPIAAYHQRAAQATCRPLLERDIEGREPLDTQVGYAGSHPIGADPVFYLHWTLGRWGTGMGAFAPEALAEYERCFGAAATIHASCEDYRAAASIDLVHDEADLHRRIECPLLALWGRRGLMERHFDVLATWRDKAAGPVSGRALDCGHFLPEERPDETAQELLAFFSD
jgi:pimeloyl-ACP methyl ester carboxylesterase